MNFHNQLLGKCLENDRLSNYHLIVRALHISPTMLHSIIIGLFLQHRTEGDTECSYGSITKDHLMSEYAKCALPKVSPCGKKPCQNGGTCKNEANAKYHCICRNGYSGKDCQYSKYSLFPQFSWIHIIPAG